MSGMIRLPVGNTPERVLAIQRAEVAILEHSVETYRILLAKYERKLADARTRLARSEEYGK